MKIKIKMKEIVKKTLKYFLLVLISKISDWQYSGLRPLRWLSDILCRLLYFVIGGRYYYMLSSIKKSKIEKSKKTRRSLFARIYSRFSKRVLKDTFFMRALAGDQTTSGAEYLRFLEKSHFSASERLMWAQNFMGLGRLDLALAGFYGLIVQGLTEVPPEIRLTALRYAGIVHFLQGGNSEATQYWQLARQLWRVSLKPSTPKGYRILGPGWFAAFGHVCMLEYYLKHQRLYGKNTSRIVAPLSTEQNKWGDLMAKFIDLGIVVLAPEELEADYNQWAENKFPKWAALSEMEKATLVDEFWEYEFPQGKSLGFAHAIARIQREWENSGRAALFILTDQERNWIQSYLATTTWGLPPGAWYVCLHVREAGFHKDWNALYPSMRDADIADYTLAIERIVKAGGWVFRMGDKSMKPLPPMPQVIDYAHSPFKTPLADIFLAASCRFLLGTNSGFANVCSMYNVPCALSNWVPLGWPLWSSRDLIMPKLFRDKQTGKYLNLKESFQRGLVYFQNWSDLPSNVELVSNTPEELADLVSEMLLYCEAGKPKNYITELASSPAQKYYEKIANQYGGYAASLLARSFVEKHAAVFADPEAVQSEHEETLQISSTAVPC